MINITESTYSSYIAYSGSTANFEYFYSNGTIIPAWIESNSSGKLITWVKTVSIPASSHIQIYLGFASKTTNLLSSSGTSGIGEAPQLPCGTTATSSCSTYAEYDDGASVFNFYDNFAGTTLSSKWDIATGASATVDNGVTVSLASGDNWYGIYTASFTTTQSIAETYAKDNGGTNSGFDIATDGLTYQEASGAGYWQFGTGGSVTSSPTANGNTGGTAVTGTMYLESAYINSGSPIIQENYNTVVTGTYTITTPTAIGLGTTASNSAFFQWFRVRAYPPNGAMPTVTFDFPQATGTDFQQMINITESSFSSYLTYNSNFANFEYFYANGTIIPSWIESNDSGKLVTWAKLSKSIPALSNTTIYLGFAGSNNLLSSSGATGIGEAPQLSATYAEYDDGAKVFNNYWNFAGTSLPSGLTASGANYIVNNGLTVEAIIEGTLDSPGNIISSSMFSTPLVVESYAPSFPLALSSDFYEFGLITASPSNNGGTYISSSLSSIHGLQQSNAGIGTPSANLATSSLSNVILSIIPYSASASEYKLNYGVSVASIADAPTYPLSLGWYGTAASSPSSYYYWRTRAYPPNGVMPTVTFGSVS